MQLLAILIAAAVAGGILSRQLKKRGKEIQSLGKVQTFTVFFLVFFMGMRIGSDERILDSIESIGISAVVVTIATMGGSILAVFALRKCLKIDRKGNKPDD